MKNEPLRFGRYLLTASLGRGAHSEVFLARRDGDEVDCALKRLQPQLAGDADKRAELAHEADVLANVAGWPVPALRDRDIEAASAPLPYLARAWVDGATLVALAKASHGARIAALAAALDAVVALHGRGIACGDVAPANVVIANDGRAWIVDLGLAAAPGLPGPAALCGSATPAFSTPEVAAGGRADARSDIFAFASLAAWLLVGATPWSHLEQAARVQALAAGRQGAGSVVVGLGAQLGPMLASAMARCWSFDARARPNAATLRAAFATVDVKALIAAVAAAAAPPPPLQVPLAAEDRGELVTGPSDAGATVAAAAATAPSRR